MDGIFPELTRRFDAAKPLGYLNFATGAGDARFRKFLTDVFGFLRDRAEAAPWTVTGGWLAQTAADLKQGGSAAFADTAQLDAVIQAAFTHLPAAYRAHHADLLAHQPDDMLFPAFAIARACEVVLRLRAARPDDSPEDLAAAAVPALSDYVGYRPIAVLETRPQTDFYPHEKVAPVPLYFPGVGVAPGPYADLLRPALELLTQTDGELRQEAGFDPDKLDELGLDPRAADHFHPVDKRPSVLFGEWDPHRIDGRGFYRRFVLRQPTLDALARWAGPAGTNPERLFESAAVLAGTVLMGAGVSGAGPTHHDSSVSLAPLVQGIARYRDAFYNKLLKDLPGKHGERLRDEAAKRKQPFAGVRQFLNAEIATDRALHLQERRLAMAFAGMGYPAAARERAARIPAPAARMATEIRLRQTDADFAARAGDARGAADLLAEAEDILRRGIDCGALMDPWNILGYQGLFPLFPGRDDTVRDPRAEELVRTVGRQFDRYASALSSASTARDAAAVERLQLAQRGLADWWDAFATSTVNDMPRVVGAERADAAEHVARALALWADDGSAQPAFWRQHRDGFKTPAAYSQVIEALLARHEFKAAMALLATWLSEADEVPLEDPAASFFRLANRWLGGVLAAADPGPLVRRFFALLEANADDRWDVPEFGTPRGKDDDDEDDDEEADGDDFASAYENVTFKDSADDGTDGPIADGGGGKAAAPDEFALDDDADRLEERLKFLAAVAKLWRAAARPDLWPADAAAELADVTRAAEQNLRKLRVLIDALAAVDVPEAGGGLDGVMEFDRRRETRGQLLELAVDTAVATTAAARALAAARPRPLLSATTADAADWPALAVRLERAIGLNDAAAARVLIPPFVAAFRGEPLLVHPPADDGPPEPALRAQVAQQLVESLLTRLPRLGLLRETYQLTRLARSMERNNPPDGKRVSSFDQLFRKAVVGVIDALVGSAAAWGPGSAKPGDLATALKQIAESFHALWLEHSQTLRLSALEAVSGDDDWAALKKFIKEYGGDLFTVRFLTLSNLRGILSQGGAAWLDRQADPDQQSSLTAGETTPKLVTAWADGPLDKTAAARHFEVVLQALVEHYDEYRDYKTTTTQSDYGENLYILLDFLRLKVAYERFAWRLRPLSLSHEVLCRRGLDSLAKDWRAFVAGKTGGLAEELLTKLAARETEHGIRVRTIRDRLEERFLQPLQIDQAAARVAPAAAAAQAGRGTAVEAHPAFAALQAAIRPLAESPSGVGLDVPAWLRRLEDELRRVRAGVDLDADDPKAAGPNLGYADLARQLAEWEKAIGD